MGNQIYYFKSWIQQFQMDIRLLRKKAIASIKQNLGQISLLPESHLSEAEEFFLTLKNYPEKIASQSNAKLAKKIFGTNYRCINDEEQFQYSNNLKALTLALFQICFQDDYTAQFIISELIQNSQLLAKIQNFPLNQIYKEDQYFTILKHLIYELCEKAQQNQDSPIRNILCTSELTLQMVSLIFRCILIKLNYPFAQNYQSQQISKKTAEIFTIICEYLDINMIAKNITSNKNENSDSSQIYLFTDYNIFICTHDNQQFISGIYFQNQDELKQANQVNKSQISFLLEKSRKLEGKELGKSQVKNPLKISEFSLDLGMSGSGFIFPSPQDPYFFNSNAPTPEFGLQGSQSLRFRKSIEPERNEAQHNYFPIQQQSYSMEVTQKKYKTSFVKENSSSIIFDGGKEQEIFEESPKTREFKKEQKPKSPPTLAGVAELRIIKKKKKVEDQLKTDQKPINISNQQEEEKDMRNFQTFSKKSKLYNVVQEINKKDKNNKIQENSESNQHSNSQKSQNNAPPLQTTKLQQYIYPQKLPERQIKNQIKPNLINFAFNQSDKKLSPSKQEKFRRFSENKILNSFQSVGSRSQNLILNYHLGSLNEKGERKQQNQNALWEIKQKLFEINIKDNKNGLRSPKNREGSKSQKSLDTCRSNKKFEESRFPANLLLNRKKGTQRKCPEFLRNNKCLPKQKKIIDPINEHKKFHINEQTRLKSPQNKLNQLNPQYFKSQLLAITNKKISKQIVIETKNQTQQHQISLKKSKSAQSFPNANQQHKFSLETQKNMSYSIMPENFQLNVDKNDNSFTSIGHNFSHPIQFRELQNEAKYCHSTPNILQQTLVLPPIIKTTQQILVILVPPEKNEIPKKNLNTLLNKYYEPVKYLNYELQHPHPTIFRQSEAIYYHNYSYPNRTIQKTHQQVQKHNSFHSFHNFHGQIPRT